MTTNDSKHTQWTENFAEKQARWDRGEVSLADCHKRGVTHRAYGWAMSGLGFKASEEEKSAYRAGYYGQPLTSGHQGAILSQHKEIPNATDQPQEKDQPG